MLGDQYTRIQTLLRFHGCMQPFWRGLSPAKFAGFPSTDHSGKHSQINHHSGKNAYSSIHQHHPKKCAPSLVLEVKIKMTSTESRQTCINSPLLKSHINLPEHSMNHASTWHYHKKLKKKSQGISPIGSSRSAAVEWKMIATAAHVISEIYTFS